MIITFRNHFSKLLSNNDRAHEWSKRRKFPRNRGNKAINVATDLHKFQRPSLIVLEAASNRNPFVVSTCIVPLWVIGALNSGYSGGSEGASGYSSDVYASLSKLGWRGGTPSPPPSPPPLLVRRSWLQSDFEINYYYNPRVSPRRLAFPERNDSAGTRERKREKREKRRFKATATH